MKKVILFLFLLLIQVQSVLGQKTLKDVISQVSKVTNYSSSFSYYDSAKEKQGISIQKEIQVLKELKLKPLKHSEYYITGKYEINNMLVLFFSEYSYSENTHFAILLDKSLNVIDRLNQTSYTNDEGFYEVNSWISYNIITLNIHNIYNKPEYRIKMYSITNTGFKPVKNQVIIHTPSGIRVRNKPTTKSAVVTAVPNLTAFDYISRSSELDATSVFDNGKYLKNYWFKIASKDSLRQLGYVFGAFAKRRIEVITNDYKVVIDKINKEEYEIEQEKLIENHPTQKIKDIKQIKSILKEQLIGTSYDSYYAIQKIVADNGQQINNLVSEECIISAYFPEHHYLLLECGHASDYLIDLSNGDDITYTKGVPDYYVPSPQKTFKLNGYYSGQSSVTYLEKNKNKGIVEYLIGFNSLLGLDYIEKQFWTNDNTLIFKAETDYYKIQLQEI